MRTPGEIAAAQKLVDALRGFSDRGAGNAVTTVTNSGPALNAARELVLCGELPANGAQNSDGEWERYWSLSDPVGSLKLAP